MVPLRPTARCYLTAIDRADGSVTGYRRGRDLATAGRDECSHCSIWRVAAC